MKIQLFIINPFDRKTLVFRCEPTMQVKELINLLETFFRHPGITYTLRANNTTLLPDKMLQDYNIGNDTTIYTNILEKKLDEMLSNLHLVSSMRI